MKYKCLKCGCEFEAARDVVCPDCGAWSNSDIESLYKYDRTRKTVERPAEIIQENLETSAEVPLAE